MKYINSDKSKKQLIAQYLNDLKSANPEKIGKALLDLFFADYPTIEEEAKKFESNKNNFIKFVSIYIRAMKGKFDYVIKLADFITDESEYVRKIAIAGINSLFQEKIITHDYIQIKELKNEYDNIKDKLIKLKDVVRWDEKENIYTIK